MNEESQPMEWADEEPTNKQDNEGTKKDEDLEAGNVSIPEATTDGAPLWAMIPPNFKFPRNRQPIFIFLKAEWLEERSKASEHQDMGRGRSLILWSLNIADTKLAYGRSMGDPLRAIDELSKQMIRAIDGEAVDWSNASIEAFWDQIGPKCRHMIKRIYNSQHSLNTNDVRDFLQNCVAVRTAGG